MIKNRQIYSVSILGKEDPLMGKFAHSRMPTPSFDSFGKYLRRIQISPNFVSYIYILYSFK